MLREEIKRSHLSSSDSPCPSASLGDENSPLKWKGQAVTEAFEERERLERTPSSVSWVLEQMELESGA